MLAAKKTGGNYLNPYMTPEKAHVSDLQGNKEAL